MFDNNLYNLMMQATQEHVSLWRIQNEYIKDATDELKEFWKRMAEDKESHILELRSLIKKELEK